MATATPAVARFEITGRNGAALRQFYGDLFDWKIQEGATGSGFGVVPPSDRGISGVIGPDRSGGSGHVTFYVEVDDLASYLARAEELGGKSLVPPTEIAEFGLTFAFFADPEGHVVGLSKGVLD
jgi:predicted enzyme related to lactoylglutathione lyase